MLQIPKKGRQHRTGEIGRGGGGGGGCGCVADPKERETAQNWADKHV